MSKTKKINLGAYALVLIIAGVCLGAWIYLFPHSAIKGYTND